jgi:hypothetical protein
LDVVLQVMVGHKVDAAHEPREVVSRQSDDQVEAGRDAPLLEPLHPLDKAVETGRPVHDLERLRVDALKPDFKPGEPGCGQQVRQRPDRFGGFAEERIASPRSTGRSGSPFGGARVRDGSAFTPDSPFHRPAAAAVSPPQHRPAGFVV